MRGVRWGVAAAMLLAPLLQAVPAQAADEPVIEVQAPEGAWEGWYRRDVVIKVSAKSTWPLALLTWARKKPDSSVDNGFFESSGTSFSVGERGVTDFTFTASDMFGGTKVAKYGVGIDPDAPAIGFGSLQGDAIVLGQGAEVPFTYSCTEDLTLVKSCTAPRPSGQLIPTANLGVVRETVRAEDMVGNVRTRVLSYQVMGPLHNTEAPRIVGTARAGSTLTYTGGTFTPEASVTAQWFRAGTPVGTGRSYTLTDADIGHIMTVRTTAKKENFRDVEVASAPTAAVERRLFDVTGSLAVRGDAVVGQQLSLGLPTLNPAPTTTTYQWYRNGGAIPGANRPTYSVTSADANSTLSAGVVFERAAHEPVRPFTGPTNTVLAPLTVERSATVRGPAVIGRTLASDAPLFSGPVDRLAYMWLRDGTPIAGATSTSYRLGAADIGRRIALRVVAQSARRPDAESRSVSTAPIAKAAPSVSTKAKARGKGRVQIQVKVSAYAVTPTGKVTIKLGSKVVARNKTLKGGRLRVNLSRQPRRKVSYTIVYSGSPQVNGKSVRAAKIRIR